MTYRQLFSREYAHSLVGSLLLLGVAFIADHYANAYALVYLARTSSAHVGDLVLDNLPIVNLNFLIVEGALFAIVLSVLFILLRPRYILFTLKAFALFIIVRAFFMSLTHVGIYPGQINPGPGPFDAIYSYLNFQTGFFFSGHTGAPFLMALVFWEKLPLRIAYLLLSIVFGIAVLLAHIHYSIDVFAAPFIVYGVFEFTRKVFPRDYALMAASSR
ncbi:MAG: phosphatase PAP2-related protein [Minisyncoccia bacterium]